MSRQVTVALVGMCGYGDSYLSALLEHAEQRSCRVVGVVDPTAARSPRLAQVRERGIPVHANLAGLYAHGAPPDLVMMATPIYLHARHTQAALGHGSNVLCEKPAAATVADAQRMLEAEERSGRFAAIGYQWSFSRAIQALKHDVLRGALGRPLRLRSLVLFPRGRAYYRRNGWAGRITTESGDPVFDGPANNAAAHYLHNMLYVIGPARNLSAAPAEVQSELYRANPIESHDTAVIRARTACGADVVIATSHATPRRVGPRLRFEFERATVTYGEESPADEVIARFRDGRVVRYGRPEADRNEKMWQSVDAARNGAPVACGVRAAIAHTWCIAAAHESAGDAVAIPEPFLRTARHDVEGEMVTADGLEAVLLDCYQHGGLPSETCLAPWARPGKVVCPQVGGCAGNAPAADRRGSVAPAAAPA